MRRIVFGALTIAFTSVIGAAGAGAQSFEQLSDGVKEYVAVSEPVVVLTHVRVIDGTGAPAASDQTVVIENGRITAVGPAASVAAPAGARVMDLTGHTVLPGFVGLHDHTFYTTPGRSVQSDFSAPRLYLASGVTTIRTTGSVSPYSEIALKRDIELGREPGPRMEITGPYLTGEGASSGMAAITTPEEARRVVNYWADEGATWLKFYTTISREAMKATIDQAHQRGLELTGHLCSVGYREAVSFGIDNLEHSMLANSEWDANKKPDECPQTAMGSLMSVDIASDDVQRTIRAMVDNGVALTTTPAVFELFVKGRPPIQQRVMDAMSGETRDEYMRSREQIASSPTGGLPESLLLKSLAFDKAFMEAGGLLAAGVDPTGNGGALFGFGDQRNCELLIEGGFTPPEAVRIMSLNGAKVLGMDGDIGSIEAGKKADLMVIRGDPAAQAADI
ncbi:MAG: amidohydrolase family protein, partial [Longimicrobiales bacterium]